MKYSDGTDVVLGDIVLVPVPSGNAKARVVMLGEDYSCLAIKQKFIDWVTREKILRPSAIVIEWIEENPFAHNNPNYAPVDNYMFTDLDEFVIPVRE